MKLGTRIDSPLKVIFLVRDTFDAGIGWVLLPHAVANDPMATNTTAARTIFFCFIKQHMKLRCWAIELAENYKKQ